MFVASPASADEQLFSQSALAVINRNFPSANVSYLLLDGSGNVLAERWSTQQAISPGSLLKPFLAVAYGEQHHGRFPTVRCLGTRSRCWLPRDHGSLGLEEAITQSCNAYFLDLAAALDRASAWRELTPGYTVQEIFSTKREEVRTKASEMITRIRLCLQADPS